MNLFSKLNQRAEMNKPIRIGLIGLGKFGSMYMAQAIKCPGIHVVAIADLDISRAQNNLIKIGWPSDRFNAKNLNSAIRQKSTYLCDDWRSIISCSEIELIIECTGDSISAVEHCLSSFEYGKHVLNVTVEADALCGLMLANYAKNAGLIYSLAYGDQPALVSELVDWAQTCGFPVIAAGRGHKWLPHYRESTPDTVWDYWGLTREQAKTGGLNSKMFNSFLDGSKPAIESAAISNATKLVSPPGGLSFPVGSIDDIPNLMRPISDGGILEKNGTVEVISCLTDDGNIIPYDIRKGVWVCFKAETEYIKRCLKEYKVVTDTSGQYMAMYRRWHMIGLELGISVASIGLRGEATGSPQVFNSDVIAAAKRDLSFGEVLDGEGGYMVFGKLIPANESIKSGYLPLGLACDLKLKRKVMKDQILCWNDVEINSTLKAYCLRKEQEEETRIKK